MAEKLGDAVLDLRTDDRRYNKGLAKAHKGALALDKGFTKVAGSVSTAMQGMAGRAGLLGGAMSALGPAGLAAAAGIGAFTLGLKSALDGARAAVIEFDRIAKTADNIGLTTDALQEMRFVGERMGVTVAQVDSALEAFGKRLGELRAGTGSLSTLLDKTDPALKQLLVNARNNDEALNILLDAMAGTADQANRLALSSAAFGRGPGVAMAKVARDGAEAIRALRQEARDLGIVIDEHMLRKAEETSDQLTNMQRVIDANLSQALVDLAPILVSTAALFADIARAVADVVDSFRDVEDMSTRGIERRGEELAREIVALNKARAALDSPVTGEPVGLDVARAEALERQVAEKIEESRRLSEELGRRQAATRGRSGTGTDTGGGGKPAKLDDAIPDSDGLAESLRQLSTETELLRLNNEEQEVRRAVLAAQRVAMDEGRLLRADEIAVIEREVHVQQNLRQAEQAGLAARRAGEALQQEGLRLKEQLATAEERHNAALARAQQLYDAGAISLETYNREVARAGAELERTTFGVDDLASAIDGQLNQALNGSIDSWEDLGRVALSVLDDILKTVAQMEGVGGGGGGGIFSTILGLVGAVAGGGGGISAGGLNASGAGQISNSLGTWAIPRFRAAGGPQAADEPGIVGEIGPELWIPDTPGTVLPNGALQGLERGGGPTVFIDATNSSEAGYQQLAAQVKALNGSIERRAVAATVQARRRDPGLFGLGRR